MEQAKKVETSAVIKISMDKDYPYDFGCGIYVHGELESRMGYDIPLTTDTNMATLDEGIYHVLIQGSAESGDKTPEQAIMFVWKARIGAGEGTEIQRGFIVANNDTRSLIHAIGQFEEKPKYL